MKLNRFIALAAIALLIVGAMGAVSMKVFAQPASQTENCDQQDDDTAEVQDAPDTDNVDLKCGDQNEADDAETAPIGTPAITAEAAQKTAEAYLNAGTATKVELDDENGKLIYSVEFANNTDVKVDAMTGDVLGTEPTED
jgi:uncharacterized membrane protein YkoI